MKRQSTPFTKVLCVIFFFLSQFAIGQVFVFNFENTTNVTTDNAIGTPAFASNGIGGTTYNTTTPCQGARMYSANDWDSGDYYQFTVNTTGYGNLGFSFCNRTSNTDIGTFIVRVSPDGTNWTPVTPVKFTPVIVNELPIHPAAGEIFVIPGIAVPVNAALSIINVLLFVAFEVL